MKELEHKISVRFTSDPDGFFALTTVSNLEMFAFGSTPEKAQEQLVRKVRHLLNPAMVPQPKEITIYEYTHNS